MELAGMDYFCDQVQQKDVGRRLQVGQELLEYLSDPARSPDLEQDQQRLDKVIDELTAWVNSSNFKVALLGLDVLGAFVNRLSGRFKSYIGTVLLPLIDRMGDAKDQVREQAQNLILKLMDEAAPPMYIWERLVIGFKHKNYRSREGVCLCLIATLNIYGAQPLILSKLVPHLCTVFGDSNSQVRDAAILAIVEVYRHVGEKVRIDLTKRGIPPGRLQTIFAKFDEVRNSGNMILSSVSDKSFDDEESVDGNRPSSAASAFKVPAPKKPGNPSNSARKPGSAGGPKVGGSTKEGGAGAVDEDDFIKAFTDVPTVQIYSSRELEETLNKIREILSDDKHDWDQRTNALKKVRSLLVAGAAQYDGFFQHLRLLDGAFKLSAKDLRSQVVREACITVAHLSTVLGNKFDHGAEAIVPTLFNLVPNSAKVMATSGCAAIRFIIRHTHVPRLIPLITSNCTSKSVAVRRRSFEFLDLLLQEWQTHSLERHAAVLVETIKKGIHDADAEARVEARKAYLGLRNHFPSEAETLYNSLEPPYQRSLQTYLKNSGSIASLPQSDRSSSSSQESLNRPLSSKWSAASPASLAGRVSGSSKGVPSPGTLQRSRSDIDVNAAAGAKARHAAGQTAGAGRLSAAGLPPGSYASLEDTSDKMDGTASEDGRIRTKLSTPSVGIGNSKTDSRGRSRTKVVSQSQPGSRSGSPGRVLTTTTLSTMNTGVQRVLVNPAAAQKRSKIPRSQGCSREASPSRLSVGTGFGISQSSRLSSSVSAMRVLNTGSDVEEAVADALKKPVRRRYESYGMYSDDDANSDASSACSERSYSSRNGSIPTYMRQTEDVAEVLNRCASSNWSERKEGLLGLQNLLKNQRTLSRVELKRLCEIFTRMFADPHSKVFSMFLETLVDFIQVHKEDLQDWLFVLLTQLLKKMGADLLGSVQAKVQKALDVTRESFPNDLQFSILMRFTVDQTQTPSLKVKVAILKYIETLAQQMDPGDFVNSSETRLAVSRIITWTTEPKSSDVRKAAQSVLISLFELNTPEFTMLLGALPKTFQDGATKLLHNHLRNTGNSGQGSMGSPLARPTPRSPASWSSPLTSPTNTSQNTLSPSAFDYDTENMNSEDIYSSLRGVTEAIQNFSFRTQEDMNEPLKRDSKKDDGDSICSASGIVDLRAGSGVSDTGRTALDNKTSLLNTMPPHSSPRSRDYNPYNYSDGISPFNKSALKEAMFDDDAEQFPDEPPMDHSDLVAELLKELSNHNERVEERKAALYELMKLTQEESFGVWDEHFKTILLLLLETLGDKEHAIRALALKVLREILRNQPARFKNYAELTIMKTLEAHKDPHKEVVRSAEEAASMLATSISPDQCIKVLCPIIQTADYPINLAAIKMQTKVIERVSKETLTQLLPEIVPGLIQGYDNSESSVRKACVFCLVAIHAVIGDELKPHLSQLTGSKMKLLNLYIKRAQTGSGPGDTTADMSGQS
ncbi:CLIP-associating protein 2 isoform X20 [Falco biarmicus]|uniref:CLIP-associating protein 2 isoform X23 n=1 Tax=Falco rusticolus TaxID=120794 RepID=UPI0018865C1F|nr:CLIP-associating protein 2 isoform X23 [Falco rusticolus]XP_055566462.1 CLIP-associating protein 2 isoform X20 [Falco cherrug]XP_056194792.1 CLIP-associating protein 2 isoform X20 [Falco biarmicus]